MMMMMMTDEVEKSKHGQTGLNSLSSENFWTKNYWVGWKYPVGEYDLHDLHDLHDLQP